MEVETNTALKVKATGLLTLGQKTVAEVGVVTAAVMVEELLTGTGELELEVGMAEVGKVRAKTALAELAGLALNTAHHGELELAAVRVGMSKGIMAEVVEQSGAVEQEELQMVGGAKTKMEQEAKAGLKVMVLIQTITQDIVEYVAKMLGDFLEGTILLMAAGRAADQAELEQVAAAVKAAGAVFV